ncbi:hypothetical protein HanXRQr2_Chr05g0198261 [Helianthus annuus]|uniref:Uncharacterized protein n=1 Tax=Helianthus annuus TaxID=4232 RepID=A0A9K3NLC8_HELAN|nr:hypothetical protein HanXRQr2_Chr05g0198261 [Helianthus annuus]KAJ0921418.1 hypothetical protein HanPSC8_Chr05g0191281 [Helianthus annuus]
MPIHHHLVTIITMSSERRTCTFRASKTREATYQVRSMRFIRLYEIMDRHHEEQAIEDRVREKRIVRNSWSNNFIFVHYF